MTNAPTVNNSTPTTTAHFHAVVWLDHHKAEVIQFNESTSEVKKLHDEKHDTGQHNSNVRTEHEFFGKVCDALAGIREVVVTAGHTSLADFRHYVTKHRPLVLPMIVGWEVMDHASEGQLVAFARKFFIQYESMASSISANALHKAGQQGH